MGSVSFVAVLLENKESQFLNLHHFVVSIIQNFLENFSEKSIVDFFFFTL